MRDYAFDLIPRRELCKRLEELNICQEGPCMFWTCEYEEVEDGETKKVNWELENDPEIGDEAIVTPLLPDLIKALPVSSIKCLGGKYLVTIVFGVGYEQLQEIRTDGLFLPDVIAEALISLEELKLRWK